MTIPVDDERRGRCLRLMIPLVVVRFKRSIDFVEQRRFSMVGDRKVVFVEGTWVHQA